MLKNNVSSIFRKNTYSVNCSTLFREKDILERPAAARKAGFIQVEFWWPFDGNPVPGDREVDQFITSLENAGTRLTGLNFWAGNMAAGDRGMLSVPGSAAQFAENADIVAAIGERTGCRYFNALYGLQRDDTDPWSQSELAIENLHRAAQAVARINGTVLIEPVSGAAAYPLKTATDALAVVDQAKKAHIDNVAFLADFYHLAVNGDDVEAVIRNHSSDFGHIQIADSPGRGAPGTGSLPLVQWLQSSYAQGYTGNISLEYIQDENTAFTWLDGISDSGAATQHYQ